MSNEYLRKLNDALPGQRKRVQDRAVELGLQQAADALNQSIQSSVHLNKTEKPLRSIQVTRAERVVTRQRVVVNNTSSSPHSSCSSPSSAGGSEYLAEDSDMESEGPSRDSSVPEQPAAPPKQPVAMTAALGNFLKKRSHQPASEGTMQGFLQEACPSMSDNVASKLAEVMSEQGFSYERLTAEAAYKTYAIEHFTRSPVKMGVGYAADVVRALQERMEEGRPADFTGATRAKKSKKGDVQPAAITHTSLIQDFAAMYTANNPDSTWDEINKAYPDEIDAFVERLAEDYTEKDAEGYRDQLAGRIRKLRRGKDGAAALKGRGYARHLRKVQQKRQLVDTPAESEAKELKAAVKQAKDKLAAALRTHGDATMVLEHLQDRADKGEDVSDARTDAQQELDEARQQMRAAYKAVELAKSTLEAFTTAQEVAAAEAAAGGGGGAAAASAAGGRSGATAAAAAGDSGHPSQPGDAAAADKEAASGLLAMANAAGGERNAATAADAVKAAKVAAAYTAYPDYDEYNGDHMQFIICCMGERDKIKQQLLDAKLRVPAWVTNTDPISSLKPGYTVLLMGMAHKQAAAATILAKATPYTIMLDLKKPTWSFQITEVSSAVKEGIYHVNGDAVTAAQLNNLRPGLVVDLWPLVGVMAFYKGVYAAVVKV